MSVLVRALVAAVFVGAAGVSAAVAERSEAQSALQFAQVETTEDAAEPEEIFDAALRADLDTMPDDMLVDLFPELAEFYPEYAGATSSVGLTGVRWTSNVVTVAFNGGTPAVRELIERTAAEWTRDSSFRFSFRDAQNRFREWRPTDQTRAADIRIGFSEKGYWSKLGTLAIDTSFSPLHRPTMNLGGLDTALLDFVGPENREKWLRDYYHHVVLHEFGHALGLAHEHFHNDCQRDLRLDNDPGYRRTPANELGPYTPDSAGRRPGALLIYQGLPNDWSDTKARFNLSAETYFERTQQDMQRELGARSPVQTTRNIDRHSVMMYALHSSLLRSGENSPCFSLGPGRMNDGTRFATTLSAGDLAYFRQHYHRP